MRCPPPPFSAAASALVLTPGLQLWEYNEHTRRWQEAEFVAGSERQHDDAIHGIAWAPNLGRSYHLLATASKGAPLLSLLNSAQASEGATAVLQKERASCVCSRVGEMKEERREGYVVRDKCTMRYRVERGERGVEGLLR